MPNRVIREGILTSPRVDQIASVPECEVLYRRIQSVVDDYGRGSADPRIIRASCYPLRLDHVTETQIVEHLRACEAAGLMRLYSVDGKPYLELIDFNQQLRIKRSKHPEPPPIASIARAEHVVSNGLTRVFDLLPESESEKNPNIESEGERESEVSLETEIVEEGESGPPPSIDFDCDLGFEELWMTYPAKGRIKRPLAEQAYVDVMLPALNRRALHNQILTAMRGPWAASEMWAKGIVCGLDRFLCEQRWSEAPAPAERIESAADRAAEMALKGNF